MAKRANNSKTSKMWLPQVWWVPIVVALIGLGAVIYPLITKQETPTPSPLPSFQYSVRVQAKETGQNIPNAQVIIEIIGQAPLDEVTDSNGFARVFIDANRVGQPSRLIVQATGYNTYNQSIDLVKDTLPDVIQLESTP